MNLLVTVLNSLLDSAGGTFVTITCFIDKITFTDQNLFVEYRLIKIRPSYVLFCIEYIIILDSFKNILPHKINIHENNLMVEKYLI